MRRSDPVRVLVIACLVVLMCATADAAVLLQVQGNASGKNMLTQAGWKGFGRGYQLDTSVNRLGKDSFRCENAAADTDSGLFQSLTLNQKSPNAIRVNAWSKAEGTGNAGRGDYAIYLDILYDDGSWVWGWQFNYGCGTHDWQRGEVLFKPDRPIKTLNVYFLFRKCTGKVWFDGCHAEQIVPSRSQTLLDDRVVRRIAESPVTSKLQTADGLKTEGFFFVRDAAAESDFVSIKDGASALGIKLNSVVAQRKDHVRFDCTATDLTGRDRAITIGFAIPMPEGKWTWWHSIRSSEAVQDDRNYCDGTPIEGGAVGQMSTYPFACMSDGKESLNLAIPMSEPCVYRIGYNGALRWYTVSFDLGFCPEQGVTKQKFSFIVYKSDLGMRAAAEKYYRIFPEYFVKRVEREGNWMAFTKVSGVRGWQDFGFAYHEGDNDIEWDAANGICSFRYTEPMSYWMPMDKSLPRTNEQVFKMLDADLKGADPTKRDWASATKLCLTEDELGNPKVYFFDAPWCDGAMFVLNCCPSIPAKPGMPVTKASMSWSREIADRLYGDKTKPQLAGEYLDSVEMASGYIDSRREHFRYAIHPLSFMTLSKRPCIVQILSTHEFASWMAEEVHKRGKLMMANGVPTRFGFMAHVFDVLGIETNWLDGDKYNPLPDEVMDFRRTMCGQKPFCFLMNTDYQEFDHAMVGKYFRRCMFWGMFPGFFSPNAATNCYFDDPKLYDRDRDLFKKYMPVIRSIARAGWQPVTMASTSRPDVEIERFGPGKDGSLYFTVRCGKKPVDGVLLKLDPRLGRPRSAVKLPADQALTVKASGEIELSLAPEEVAVVQVKL